MLVCGGGGETKTATATALSLTTLWGPCLGEAHAWGAEIEKAVARLRVCIVCAWLAASVFESCCRG